MRLTEQERRLIAQTVADVFGRDVDVRLFGSRLDDSQRGGDIDLFIDAVPCSAAEVVDRRVRLRAKLHDALGDRKIDVVVHRASGPELPVHRHARATGVPLWPP